MEHNKMVLGMPRDKGLLACTVCSLYAKSEKTPTLKLQVTLHRQLKEDTCDFRKVCKHRISRVFKF